MSIPAWGQEVLNTLADHASRLEAIDQRLGGNDRRFDEHDRRFDEHDRRFDEHDRRFDGIDRRLDALSDKIDSVNNELSAKIEAATKETVHQMGIMTESLRSAIMIIAEQQGHHVKVLRKHGKRIRTVHERERMLWVSVRGLDRRVTALEDGAQGT